MTLFSFLFLSLHLQKKKTEKAAKKGGKDFESLEARLREKAETLELSLEQKSKAMKQRDKKVTLF